MRERYILKNRDRDRERERLEAISIWIDRLGVYTHVMNALVCEKVSKIRMLGKVSFHRWFWN